MTLFRPLRPAWCPRLLLPAVLALAFPASSPAGAADAPRSVDLPADHAESALRAFSAQTGVEVVFASGVANGIRTNAVKGSFSPLEAAQRLLDGTGLAVSQDKQTGALLVERSSAPPKADAARAEPAPVARAADSAGKGQAPLKLPAKAEVNPNRDEPVELSPFVVKAESGWVATETLSGTRLRTEYKDLGNQLETFTMDFMKDMAVNTIEEALLYSVNGENEQEIVEESGDNRVTYLSQTPGRVRGLGNATRLRGSFRSNLPSDNYNLDRVTLASGPNSILFGLGSSAGAFDASPQRGSFKRSTSVKLQYSSEDSYRSSISLNHVLLKDRLAFRVAGLKADTQTHKKPNWNKSDRYYGALLFKPFKHTTINASYEKVSIDANMASRSVPIDRVTPWLRANQIANSPYATAKPGFNNGVSLPASLTPLRIYGTSPGLSQPVFIGNDPKAPPMGWENSVSVLNPANVAVFGVPDSSFDSVSNRTFLDESVFPFDVNPWGKLRSVRLGGKIQSFSLEQRILPNLYLEAAYNGEKTRQKVISPDGGTIYIDPNLYLPATLPGETVPRPNPYFGLPFIQYAMSQHQYRWVTEEWRATLTYDLDLGRKFSSSRWFKWLGRHRFMGMTDGSRRLELRHPFVQDRILDDAFIPGRTLSAIGSANWAIATNRLTHRRSYFIGADGKFDPYAQIEPIGTLGDSYEYTDALGQKRKVTQGYAGWTDPVTGRQIVTANNPVIGRYSVSSAALAVWQGYFLPDRKGLNRVVVTHGYRKDTLQFSIQDTATGRSDPSGLKSSLDEATVNPLGPKASGHTSTTGVMARPLSWLGVFYNVSSTFDIGDTYYDPYGRTYPGAAGEGFDRGVQIDLWQDKLGLRVNEYETTLGPTATTAGRLGALTDVAAKIEQRVRQLDPDIERINPGRGFPDLGYSNYRPTADTVSRGYEFTLNYRPTPNWNIRLNGAKSKATADNVATDWIEWIARRLPVWQSVVAKNGERDSAGRPLTWNTALYANTDRSLATVYQEDLLEDDINVIVAGNGQATDGARSKRANAIVNYRFSEGRWRGLGLGLATRWRTPPIIGYPVKVLPGNNKVLDISRPFYGKTEVPVDASISYRGRLKYFGGIPYSVQLNIRNLLDDSDPIPVKRYTDGTVSRLGTQEPRLFITSVDFEF